LIKDQEDGSKVKGLSTFVAIGDLLLGVWLALAVQWQSTFLPHEQGTCYDDPSWVTTNGQQNLFQRLGVLDGSTPEDSCHDFVGLWKIAIALT
jgi:hypothetical protein